MHDQEYTVYTFTSHKQGIPMFYHCIYIQILPLHILEQEYPYFIIACTLPENQGTRPGNFGLTRLGNSRVSRFTLDIHDKKNPGFTIVFTDLCSKGQHKKAADDKINNRFSDFLLRSSGIQCLIISLNSHRTCTFRVLK